MTIKREDVIIDPTDPRVEGLIGKKVICGDSLIELYSCERKGILNGIKTPNVYPFVINNGYFIFIAPIPDTTYEELAKQWVKDNHITTGTKLRVYREWYNNERGCDLNFRDCFAGIVGEFDHLAINGNAKIRSLRDDNSYYIPYFALEVVPERTYRPFKSAKEFASYAEKWCKPKDNEADFCCRIIDFSDNGVTIPDSYSPKEDVKFICISFKEAFEDFCFEDGTTFGVKE